MFAVIFLCLLAAASDPDCADARSAGSALPS